MLAVVALAVAVSGLIALTALTLFLMRHSNYVTSSVDMAAKSGMLITAVPTVAYRAVIDPPSLPTLTPATISQSAPFARVSKPAVVPLIIPLPLVDPFLSLFSGPVDVPLEIQIPVLKIKAAVVGVGLTSTNAMASPLGRYADDPMWQTVFWYRGGGVPGDVGTATLAGHFDDTLGRPAVFGYLGALKTGDLIIVRDTRTDLEIPFIVTETKTYTDQEAAKPAILTRVFGSKSVADGSLEPLSDEVSHLTLITCSGAWSQGSFEHRLVVYAIRANYPSVFGE